MATLIIPVTNDPKSQFSIQLDGNTYLISLRWNITDAAWIMDLRGLTNNVDLKGLKLVTGPDLLRPFALIDLGSLYVVDQNETELDPDFDNFGSNFQLYYVEK